MFFLISSVYRSNVRGDTLVFTAVSHRSRYSANVVLCGSMYAPVASCVISAAFSVSASFLPLASSLCHLRFRSPVSGSNTSRTAYQLPLPRSRMCPFISLSPYLWRDRGLKRRTRRPTRSYAQCLTLRDPALVIGLPLSFSRLLRLRLR